MRKSTIIRHHPKYSHVQPEYGTAAMPENRDPNRDPAARYDKHAVAGRHPDSALTPAVQRCSRCGADRINEYLLTIPSTETYLPDKAC